MNIQNQISARRLMSWLLRGSAIAGLAAMSATQVSAQTVAAAAENVETVTVTGTSIKGAAPVGANVITVDRDVIEASGSTSIQSLLVNVPALTGFGNAGQGSYGSFDGSSSNAPTIHSLGASASNSTLVLVDSHRIPLAGLAHTLSDPSTIPTIALARVEVLPDGASSIYGSDAVAGVLNFITRKNYSGAETELEYGDGLDNSSVSFGQIIGAAWDKGSVMAAYNFVGRSKLLGTDRYYVNDNQNAVRGAPFVNGSNFACAPATISPTGGPSAGQIFVSPYAAGTGVANSAAANAHCGQTPAASLLPSEDRHAALISIHQDINDWFSLSADFNWSNRTDDAAVSRGTVTAIVFGPGSGKGTQINPFYVEAPGNTTGTETVRYDFNGLFGTGAHTKSGTQLTMGTIDADFKLGGDWTASVQTVFGNSVSYSRSIGVVCTACAYLALNGTTNSSGNPATSSNPAVLSTTTLTTRPLSAANALNVWAAGAPGTASTVRTQLLDNNNFSQTTQNMNDINVSATGTVFDLPAGPIKTAFGGEYRNYGLWQYAIANGSGGPSINSSSIFNAAFGRNLYAAYAEFDIPLISRDAGIPLIRKLDLSVSGRFDHYNDVGDTKNPRLAVTWEIVDGLKARGSYGTSFVAPALTSTGGLAGLTTESAVTYGQGTGGPATAPAGYVNLGAGNSFGAPIACAAGCTVGNATNQGVTVSGPGGPSVTPELATTYSAGFDFDPGRFVSALDGLFITATYWQAKYVGAITSPVMTLDTQIPGLAKNLIINPTDAQIAAAYNGVRRVNAVPSGPVTFLQFYVQQNAFNLWANGIDFSADYRFSLQDMGDFHVGLDGSEKLRFSQQNGGAGGALVDNLNKNANTTFSSLALTARATFGWHFDPVTANIFVNYTNPYRKPDGAFPGGFQVVNSNTTVDVNLSYDVPTFNQWAAGTQLYVTADNVFNTSPPAYNTGVGYDTTDASPLGRLVLFGVRKKW